jgi:hypothetical protein
MYFGLHLAMATPFPVFMIIFPDKWSHWLIENLIIQLWHKVQISEHFLESGYGYLQSIIVAIKYLVKIVKGKTVSQMQFLIHMLIFCNMFIIVSLCLMLQQQSCGWEDPCILTPLRYSERECMRAVRKVKNVCAYNLHSCFIIPDHSFGVFSRV